MDLLQNFNSYLMDRFWNVSLHIGGNGEFFFLDLDNWYMKPIHTLEKSACKIHILFFDINGGKYEEFSNRLEILVTTKFYIQLKKTK